MATANAIDRVSVEEYLADERRSEVRHEYLGGTVYAMAGASEEHNVIAGNVFAALHAHLGDGPCRVFMADMKIRVSIARDDVFYYPDLMVTCDPRDTERYFMRFPRVVLEVPSSETERTDRREKFFSYTNLETVEEYILVAQSKMEVTVFRRSTNWNPEVLAQPSESLEVPSLRFSVPLSTIYRRISLPTSPSNS